MGRQVPVRPREFCGVARRAAACAAAATPRIDLRRCLDSPAALGARYGLGPVAVGARDAVLGVRRRDARGGGGSGRHHTGPRLRAPHVPLPRLRRRRAPAGVQSRQWIAPRRTRGVADGTACARSSQARSGVIRHRTTRIGDTPCQTGAIARDSACIGAAAWQARVIPQGPAGIGVAPDQDASVSQSARIGVARCRRADRVAHGTHAIGTRCRAGSVSRSTTSPGVTFRRSGISTRGTASNAAEPRRTGSIRHGADYPAGSISHRTNCVSGRCRRTRVAPRSAACGSVASGRAGHLPHGATDIGRIRSAAGVRRRGGPAAERHRDFPPPDPSIAHSALMPAALMIGHHFSISAFCQAPSASGVC